MRIRTIQEEYEDRLQSLVENEKKWSKETSQHNLKKNEEDFRRREQQTFRWKELKKDLKAKYEDLVELRDRCDDVSAKDIEAMTAKMEKVSLYIKSSQKAQSYLKDIGEHLKNLEKSISSYEKETKELERLTSQEYEVI